MTEQHKVNTYTMYASVTEPPDPVHYEMLGYDTLLGSHYDKYEIDYADYSPQMPPPDIFDIKGLFLFNWYNFLMLLPCILYCRKLGLDPIRGNFKASIHHITCYLSVLCLGVI